MASTLKNLTGSQYGVEAAETGIEVLGFSVRYFPEYKKKFPSRLNQTTGFAVPDKLSLEIKLNGKVKGATGIMAATHVTALALANDVNTFQATPGGIYMDEVTEDQTFDDYRGIDMSLSSDPECA